MADNSGKLVTVSYKGTLDNGWQFAEATPERPMHFPCSHGWMIPEFVDAVREMEVGETRMVHVGAGDAFQERTEERMIVIPRNRLANDTSLKPGDIAHLQSADGTEYPARLVSIDDKEAVFDANHEAVAQGLHFEITLHEVREIEE